MSMPSWNAVPVRGVELPPHGLVRLATTFGAGRAEAFLVLGSAAASLVAGLLAMAATCS